MLLFWATTCSAQGLLGEVLDIGPILIDLVEIGIEPF